MVPCVHVVSTPVNVVISVGALHTALRPTQQRREGEETCWLGLMGCGASCSSGTREM
jgi:hypothetical protein